MKSPQESAALITQKLLEGFNQAWKAEGRDAWAALKRSRGKYLEKDDRIKIARQLHIEIEALKPRLRELGISLGMFCAEAGLPDAEGYTKQLYRVTLPPGSSDKEAEKRELRAVAFTYANIISAVANYKVESVTVVAERVLRGTSLHPVESAELDKLAAIQVLLQGLVDKVDEEFDLFAKFKETARLRADHAKDGGSIRWPRYDLDITLEPDPDPEVVNQEFRMATDPKFAYWPSDVISSYREGSVWWPIANKSGCLQFDDFFYIPHAYFGALGLITESKENPARAAGQASEVAWIRQHHRNVGWIPGDAWDGRNKRPYGQTLQDKGAWQYHAWIIIYPSPSGKELMPMLYIPWEEEGPFLLPLDLKHLRFIREHGVCVGPKQVTGAIDRLSALLASGAESPVSKAFRRTAPWFDHNPFLVIKRKKETEAKLISEQIRLVYDNKR